MEPADLAFNVGLLLVGVLTLYAVLGGADFGGGVWDLLARGPRAEAQRRAIASAMGPVWEANHVWALFAFIILFSAFPKAYVALVEGFFLPLHLVLGGIVLRGAAFVFRAPGALDGRPRWAWGSVFGAASAVTPFLLGVALAGVSSGLFRVEAGPMTGASATIFPVAPGAARVDVLAVVLNPFSLATGALTLALVAYLAATFLTLETSGQLREDFRRRAFGSAVAAAALALLVLALMPASAPRLWDAFRGQALPVFEVGAVSALASLWALRARRFALARILAVVEVAVLFWGWALAQLPYIIYPDVTIWNAAAPAPVLRFVLSTLPIGLLLVVPSLWLLFSVFKGRNPMVND